MAFSAESIADLPIMYYATAMWPACGAAGLSTVSCLKISVIYMKH